MKDALKFFLSDLLSTLVFLVLLAITQSVEVTLVVAIAAGIGQIVFEKLRGKPVAAMQWLSLGLVLVFGSASLLTRDHRFVMVKPTLIHAAVGAVMLKRGWLDRYMPQIVHENVPKGVLIASGYAWAAAQFSLGAANIVFALKGDIAAWALFNTVAPLAVNFGGFALQYLLIRTLVRRVLRQKATVAA